MGLETARLRASKGAKVSLADVQEEALMKVASEIENDGGKVLATVIDIKDRAQVEAWIKRTVDVRQARRSCQSCRGYRKTY